MIVNIDIPNTVPMEKIAAFADSCNCRVVSTQAGLKFVPRDGAQVVRITQRKASVHRLPSPTGPSVA